MRQVEERSLSFSAHLQSHRCLPAPQGCAPGRLGAGRTLSLLEPLHRGDPGPAQGRLRPPPMVPARTPHSHWRASPLRRAGPPGEAGGDPWSEVSAQGCPPRPLVAPRQRAEVIIHHRVLKGRKTADQGAGGDMAPGRVGGAVQERLAECSWGGRGNARVSCPTRSCTRGELGNELTATDTLASVSLSVKRESNCAALLRIRRNKRIIVWNAVRTVPGARLPPVF